MRRQCLWLPEPVSIPAEVRRWGDLVVAMVPCGQYAGRWTGRVLIRAHGRFDSAAGGKRIVQGISHKYCRLLQRNGGWAYEHKPVSA
ncbi:hypothetical protein [Sulfobacillus thermosulfidooxidans]|uniref:hypothetical protein n=1 Tax=Sulfobacillus thermosulfidooxidans TaxID=28034 RepID=UPI0012DE42CA|nr:hypothetical protein [Sulfobacillus thermosulfidooxidans]